MKNMQFDNGVKYTEEAIGVFFKAREKKLSLETCGAALIALGRPTIEMLMHSVSEIEIDGKDFDALCDKLDDPDFEVPAEAASEVIRRLRAVNALSKKELMAHVAEGSLGDLVSLILGDLTATPLDELSDRLVLGELMLELYDRWADVDMGHFGRALRMPLQAGSLAVRSVAESLEDWEDDSEDGLSEEAEELLDHAYDLENEFDDRIGAFVEEYPDMEDCFADDEDDDEEDSPS